jgi:periodic tryptophan protein 2
MEWKTVSACTDLVPCANSCDWNRYNIRYALAVSKQRGMKRTLEPLGTEEEEEEEAEASDEDSLHLLGGAGDEEGGMLV